LDLPAPQGLRHAQLSLLARPLSQLTDPRYLTAKAAVATALAAALAHAAGVSDLLSASFVALVCITPTAYAGLRRALEQLGGAVVGGGATALLLAVLPWQGDPARQCLAAGISVGISTWACARLRWEAGHITAGFTVLYLVLLPFRSFAEGLRERGLAVLLGALAAAAVNAAVSWAFAGRILARRVRLARASVAGALRRTAAMCRDGGTPEDLAAVYAPAFAVAAELHGDLAALSREVVLSPAARCAPRPARGCRRPRGWRRSPTSASTSPCCAPTAMPRRRASPTRSRRRPTRSPRGTTSRRRPTG
jgi:hypothetical protein